MARMWMMLVGCVLVAAATAQEPGRYFQPSDPPPLPRANGPLIPIPPAENRPPPRFDPAVMPAQYAVPSPAPAAVPSPPANPAAALPPAAPYSAPNAWQPSAGPAPTIPPPPANTGAAPGTNAPQTVPDSGRPAEAQSATDEDQRLAHVIADKFGDGADFTKDRLFAVWNYPLTAVDGKQITVGTIVCCLVLIYLGYLASKLTSWWFGSRFLPRLGMHQSAVAPVQTITFYVLVATFTMLSLRLANVPLTAFTFLGGAIAIGVGFGSQNVVNNFISGLILLAERPIRVGDVIQIEGQTGKVTQIGPRSTHVTTGTNLVIVVPNSKLLEGTVINWTLSDDRIRTVIKCGVAYGSQTREVERVLRECATGMRGVLESPEPFVVFADFGDNALGFELHFWISLNDGTVRSEVESDLRFMIDERFRAAGIVMSYPQRDVHLNVLRPVEIRMAAPEAERLRSRAA